MRKLRDGTVWTLFVSSRCLAVGSVMLATCYWQTQERSQGLSLSITLTLSLSLSLWRQLSLLLLLLQLHSEVKDAEQRGVNAANNNVMALCTVSHCTLLHCLALAIEGKAVSAVYTKDKWCPALSRMLCWLTHCSQLNGPTPSLHLLLFSFKNVSESPHSISIYISFLRFCSSSCYTSFAPAKE